MPVVIGPKTGGGGGRGRTTGARNSETLQLPQRVGDVNENSPLGIPLGPAVVARTFSECRTIDVRSVRSVPSSLGPQDFVPPPRPPTSCYNYAYRTQLFATIRTFSGVPPYASAALRYSDRFRFRTSDVRSLT